MDGILRLFNPHSTLAAFRYPPSASLLFWQSSSSLKCRAAAEPQPRRKQEKIDIPEFFDADRDAAAFNLIFESTVALETARHYEIMFLVHEDHEEQAPDVVQKVKDFIEEKKGKIFRLNDWGLRKLAYKIKKAKRAHYFLMNIQMDRQYINALKSMLDQDERVIRHLVMTMKKAETKETVAPPEYSSIRDEDEDEDDLDEEYDQTDEEETDETDEEDDDDDAVAAEGEEAESEEVLTHV